MGKNSNKNKNNSPQNCDDTDSINNILTSGNYANMDTTEVMKLVLTKLCDIQIFMVNYKEEINTLKQKQAEMENSMKYLNTEVEDLKAKIKYLTSDNSSLKAGVASLTTTTETNCLKIAASEDHSRRMNLELTDIPYIEGEDCSAIALEVFDKVGVEMPEKEISIAHRVKVNAASKRIPSIVVRFRDLYFRNKVLDCRSSNRIKIADMGFNEPSDLKCQYCYINEHLTPEKKKLLYLARKLKVEKNWFYTGVKDGKLYARKIDGGTKFEIKQEKDLACFKK